MTGSIPALSFELDPRRFKAGADVIRRELRSLAAEGRKTQAALGLGAAGRFGPGGGGGGGGVPGGPPGGGIPPSVSGGGAGALAGGRFSLLGLAGGLTAVAGIRGAVRTIADFEQAIATLGGVTRATDSQLQRLSDTARELGATTRFSATEAAEGLLELARAGLSVDDAITALPATLSLATAGLLGLGEASDLATNVAAQFRLGAEDISRIGDSLVAVANRSNTTVAQLGQGLKDVGGVAAGLGTDLETTVAALGVLANVGLKGSDASIKLRQAFLQLLDPSAGAQRTLEQFGLSVADVDINSRGLIPVLESLRDANLGIAESASLVGARNALALETLFRNVDAVKSLASETRNASGEAQALADIQKDTLAGSFKELSSAAQEFALAIGDAGVGAAVRGTTEAVTGLLRVLGKVAEGFGEIVAGRGVSGSPFFANAGGSFGFGGRPAAQAGDAAGLLRFLGFDAFSVFDQTLGPNLSQAPQSVRNDAERRAFIGPAVPPQSLLDRNRAAIDARTRSRFDVPSDFVGVFPDESQPFGPEIDSTQLASNIRALEEAGRLQQEAAQRRAATIQGLQQEAEALRRTGAEREAYILAIQNGIPATRDNIAVLKENVVAIEELARADRLADGIAGSILNIGVAADLAAGNTERAVERMVRALSDLALQELALQPLRQALSSFVGGLVAGATPRQGYGGPNGYGGGVFLGGEQIA